MAAGIIETHLLFFNYGFQRGDMSFSNSEFPTQNLLYLHLIRGSDSMIELPTVVGHPTFESSKPPTPITNVNISPLEICVKTVQHS